jgi:hypothetical protein
MKTAYITKYALTRGIFTIEYKQDSWMNEETMIADKNNPLCYYHRPDWHLLHGEALLRAEEMRQAKIKSLEKQLKKIKNLTFNQ